MYNVYKYPSRQEIVYFIYRKSDNAMKIGISKNVSHRLSQLRREHKDKTLELIAYIPGYREMEARVHFLVKYKALIEIIHPEYKQD